jgi:hypothetical protein
MLGPVAMVCTCNSRYAGGRDGKDCGLIV